VKYITPYTQILRSKIISCYFINSITELMPFKNETGLKDTKMISSRMSTTDHLIAALTIAL